MHYYFLTAIRNESATLENFFNEFSRTLQELGIAKCSTLFIVDDYSTDESVQIIAKFKSITHEFDIKIIYAPTNLGNQGAMFWGLQHLELQKDDVLLTFDSDGEDDVSAFPAIIKLGALNPGKIVYIERAARTENLIFKTFFTFYKFAFRYFSGHKIVPNNYLLVPGKFIFAIQRSIFSSAHFAYGIMRLGLPFVSTSKDRRPRYSGNSSQNLFKLMSHGLVGLMVFFESALSKMFFLSFSSLAIVLLIITLKGFLQQKSENLINITNYIESFFGILSIIPMLLILSTFLAVIFKVFLYLSQTGNLGIITRKKDLLKDKCDF